jgi:starch phosphorylase
MKALANGSLNLSVLDGWWDEGYDQDFGWAIGHGELYRDHAAQDKIESRDLYNLLEKEVVPLFYRRGSDGIPRGWVEKMKAGLCRLLPIFSSHRMVQDYVNRYYLTCSKRYNALSCDDHKGARDLAEWRQRLMTSWHEVAVTEVVSGNGREMGVGQELEVLARVKLGPLGPEDATVETYYGRLDRDGGFVDRETVVMDMVEANGDVCTYRGLVPCRDTGNFGYTVRIMPSRERLENRFVWGLVTWA